MLLPYELTQNTRRNLRKYLVKDHKHACVPKDIATMWRNGGLDIGRFSGVKNGIPYDLRPNDNNIHNLQNHTRVNLNRYVNQMQHTQDHSGSERVMEMLRQLHDPGALTKTVPYCYAGVRPT